MPGQATRPHPEFDPGDPVAPGPTARSQPGDGGSLARAGTTEPKSTATSPARDALDREDNDAESVPQSGTPSELASAPAQSTAPLAGRPHRKRKRSILERIDAFISRLSTRNNFWHRVCSMIWLPYAFRSGIQMKRVDATTFTAILPFRRFNRNWYNAMAGAALLGNAEIAGGMYVFGAAGGDYTVVCKNLNYTFLRPCFGPAMYRIRPQEDLNALVAAGQEFNITLDMDVVQQIGIPGKRDKRVGRTIVTFHVTPKAHHKAKKKRRRGDSGAGEATES